MSNSKRPAPPGPSTATPTQGLDWTQAGSLLAVIALGCGNTVGAAVSSDAAASDGGIDVASAQPQDEASAGDARSPVVCSDGDYFIEVAGDAGTLTLRSACADSGSDVPSLSSFLCAEDTPCFWLSACDGNASVVLGVLAGSYLRSFTFDAGEGGTCAGR